MMREASEKVFKFFFMFLIAFLVYGWFTATLNSAGMSGGITALWPVIPALIIYRRLGLSYRELHADNELELELQDMLNEHFR